MTEAETDRGSRAIETTVGVMEPGEHHGTPQDVTETATMDTTPDTHRGVARGHLCRSVNHL